MSMKYYLLFIALLILGSLLIVVPITVNTMNNKYANSMQASIYEIRVVNGTIIARLNSMLGIKNISKTYSDANNRIIEHSIILSNGTKIRYVIYRRTGFVKIRVYRKLRPVSLDDSMLQARARYYLGLLTNNISNADIEYVFEGIRNGTSTGTAAGGAQSYLVKIVTYKAYLGSVRLPLDAYIGLTGDGELVSAGIYAFEIIHSVPVRIVSLDKAEAANIIHLPHKYTVDDIVSVDEPKYVFRPARNISCYNTENKDAIVAVPIVNVKTSDGLIHQICIVEGHVEELSYIEVVTTDSSSPAASSSADDTNKANIDTMLTASAVFIIAVVAAAAVVLNQKIGK